MDKQRQIFLLVFLIILLFAVNYSWIDSTLINFFNEQETGIVERVIDGDTIIINNKSVRLLGINSPERGEYYYEEAKIFLEEKILSKKVGLEFGKEKYDKYERILAYIFIDRKNVNLELVKEGFANFYFPSGKDKYYLDFEKAWKSCVKKNKNLCENSTDKCSNCIELKKFDYENQEIIFYNKCDFNCDLTNWEIKDEGRKNFIFPEIVLDKRKEIKIIVGEGVDASSNLFWGGEEYVWTRTGDTLFLREDNKKLVLWESY